MNAPATDLSGLDDGAAGVGRVPDADARAADEPRPLAFAGTRGWLWGAGGGHGVIMLGGRGLEDLATRASLAGLARRLAARGLPVLRIDPPGQSDGLGTAEETAEIGAAVAAVPAAIAALRQAAGVETVTLIGLRLGASIAVRAAADPVVTRLVLLAPVCRGRAHLREWRALAPGEPAGEVAGFAASEATLAEIAALDLPAEPPPPLRRVFVGVPAPAQGADALVARWRADGIEVTERPFPDLAGHIGNPTQSRAPLALFDEVVEWLAPLARPQPWPVPAGLETRLCGPDFDEDGVLIGTPALATVLCRPRAPLAGAPTVVIVNAGRNPRAGWARGGVLLARRLAAAGIASARIDLAGFGDSAPLADPPAEALYHASNLPQLGAVIAALPRHGLAGSVVLAGACSGGHLAFHAALAEPAVVGTVLVNVQRFIWRDGMSLEAAMRTGGRSTAAYLARAADWRTWRRLLKGDIDLRFVLGSLVGRGIADAGRLVAGAAAALGLGPAEHRRIREGFDTLARRGARQLVIYSAEDGGRDDFARHTGRDNAGFTRLPGTRLVILPDCDHNLTPAVARAVLAVETLTLCRRIATGG